jgi:beta-mannanase
MSQTLLAAYVGQPNYANATQQAAFTANWNSFVSAMGQAPAMMEVNIDYTQPISSWVSSTENYDIQSWKQSGLTNVIPEFGIPMTLQGDNADTDFKAIASGAWDQALLGSMEAWGNAGWKTIVIRPGYEMNDAGFPWTVTAANAADFVAAFQHIAKLAQSITGMNIIIDWNPNNDNTTTSPPLASYYPGNSYVNVVGLDIYGQPLESDSAPLDTSGNASLTGVLAFAKANGKPFALGETGGVDAAFAANLANVVTASGVPVSFVNEWDANFGGSNLRWDQTPATAAAWKAAFSEIASAGSTPTPTPTPAPTPSPTPSPNDTVVLAGSTAAITDGSGNKWTITSSRQVAINGTIDAITSDVIELAYVNGTIWQENSSKLWWGETQPNDAWAGRPGTATSPLPPTPTPTPSPTPTPIPSPNDTVVLAGSTAAITDASGSKWTITSSGQVAVNGTIDAVTSNVIELAYVNGTIWQENSNKLWWGETSPNTSWGPAAGTATSPLPAASQPVVITVPASQAGVTVSAIGATINATSGNHLFFISGHADTFNLSGGTETVTDSGSGSNMFRLPAAADGSAVFTTGVLSNADVLDLTAALKGTSWTGSASSLGSYLHVEQSGTNTELLVSASASGSRTLLATFEASKALLATILSHSIT